MRAEHAILISCEHSLLAGEAWFETKVCIRRENSCTQDMPHASIPARGARGSDGGVGGGLKKKTRITLEVETLNDFNPHQIDWRKVLQLEDNESVESYTEELDIPCVW